MKNLIFSIPVLMSNGYGLEKLNHQAMVKPELFYSAFQINFWDYKIEYLKKLLDDVEDDSLEHFNKIIDNSKDDYLRTLKYDLRYTCFHCIETLFSFLFCLRPNENGFIDDKNLIYNLSLRQPIKEPLRESLESNFKFLDSYVELNNGKTVTAGQHIFYFNIYELPEGKSFEKSISTIKSLLKILGNRFIDDEGYNAFKHGMRVFPAFDFFKFQNKDNGKELHLDVSSLVGCFEYDKSTGELNMEHRAFDPDLDYGMTHYCSWLIYMIIAFRRNYFFDKKPVQQAYIFNGEEADFIRNPGVNRVSRMSIKTGIRKEPIPKNTK